MGVKASHFKPEVPMRRPFLLQVAALVIAAAGGMSTPRVSSAQGSTQDPDSIGRRRLQPLPALASAPETGLQFGATMLGVWEATPRLTTRPSTALASVLMTTKSQVRVRVEGERWSRGNSRRLGGLLQWQKFPLPYYGIGDNTPESAEEIFTPKGVEGQFTVQQRMRGSWYATGGVRHLDQSITPDTVGVLQDGMVTGSEGGAITEFTAGVMTDTRDNLFSPRTGRIVQLSYGRSISGLWSDFGYGTLRADARTYRAIAAEHVIATHVQVVGVDGDAPFDQLALVGAGDIMRGYARGRYRDRWLMAAQGEYRSPVRKRMGAVLFAGAGINAPALDELSGRTLLPTYGAGLRVQLDKRQRTGVRADYARGRDGASGLYIGFNQAF